MVNPKDGIYAGGDYPERYDGDRNQEWWQRQMNQFGQQDRTKQIYEMPSIEDMAGIAARTVFKNEKQKRAFVRLAYKNAKFKDSEHQNMLRNWAAANIAENGVARLEALFAATNLLAPDMYRTAKGMPRDKDRTENVKRGSDFRPDYPGEPKEMR